MSIINLARGGQPLTAFPKFDSALDTTTPLANTVGGVFDTGRHTMSFTYNPHLMASQMDMLKREPVRVGDVIDLLVIPNESVINNLFFAVRVPDVGQIGATVMPGLWLVSPSGARTPLTGTGIPTFSDIALTVGSNVYKNFDKPYMVPTGHHVIVSMTVTGLPTPTGVFFEDADVKIQLASHVDTLDIVEQQ